MIDFCSPHNDYASKKKQSAVCNRETRESEPIQMDKEFDFTMTEDDSKSPKRRRTDSENRSKRRKRGDSESPSHKDPLMLTASDAVRNDVRFITLDYDDYTLPTVRLPTKRAAPEHIADALAEAYPDGITQPGRKQEFCPKPQREMSVKESTYMQMMSNFWTRDSFMTLLPIILKTNGKVTLSVLDYLCVHYSEDNNVSYPNPSCDSDDDFYIKERYDNCIKSYKRKYFDVYARRKRILVEFCLEDEPSVDKSITWAPECIRWDRKRLVGTRYVQGRRMCYLITSSGQLRHFFWSMPSGVVQYCIEHQDDIYAAKKLDDVRKSEIDEKTNKRKKYSAKRRRSTTSFCIRRKSLTLCCTDKSKVVISYDRPHTPNTTITV